MSKVGKSGGKLGGGKPSGGTPPTKRAKPTVFSKGPDGDVKVLARNRRARHEYSIEETVEAGIVLAGSEVKAIRDGRAALVDAFAEVSHNEAWLHQMDVSPWKWAHARNHEQRRRRKLLLHRREIDRLAGKLKGTGYTLVPLSLYLRNGHIKAEIALVKGKQDWDKRQDVKKRESDREIERGMASRRR